MDSNNWNTRVFKTNSRRYQSAVQSRSDLFDGFEEIDFDDEPKADYACPFCYVDFDIIGLCCHIDDEHPAESKNGVCPICGTRVGMDMVGHIAMQHEKFFKMQRKKKLRRGGSHSNLSLLKKELRDTILGGSSVVSYSNAAPDPLLSSFINNLPMVDEPETVKPPSSAGLGSFSETSDEQVFERSIQPPLSDKDQEERASRCEFVQGLLLSTMFDDIL